MNVNGKMFYYEEVEINDYPQKARFALNNRTEMDRIQDWTGASVGIRGNYVPPGRKPALGSRKLHLYIEADSPAKVTRAKTECISFLENATKGGSYDTDMIKAYTSYHVCLDKKWSEGFYKSTIVNKFSEQTVYKKSLNRAGWRTAHVKPFWYRNTIPVTFLRILAPCCELKKVDRLIGVILFSTDSSALG